MRQGLGVRERFIGILFLRGEAVLRALARLNILWMLLPLSLIVVHIVLGNQAAYSLMSSSDVKLRTRYVNQGHRQPVNFEARLIFANSERSAINGVILRIAGTQSLSAELPLNRGEFDVSEQAGVSGRLIGRVRLENVSAPFPPMYKSASTGGTISIDIWWIPDKKIPSGGDYTAYLLVEVEEVEQVLRSEEAHFTIMPPLPTATPSATMTQTPTSTPTATLTATPTATATPYANAHEYADCHFYRYSYRDCYPYANAHEYADCHFYRYSYRDRHLYADADHYKDCYTDQDCARSAEEKTEINENSITYQYGDADSDTDNRSYPHADACSDIHARSDEYGDAYADGALLRGRRRLFRRG